MDQQLQSRADGGGEERWQKQGAARAQQCQHSTEKGRDQTDLHQRFSANASSTAETKTSVGCAPTIGSPETMNAGVE